MSDLVEFLLARIAEEEALARRVQERTRHEPPATIGGVGDLGLVGYPYCRVLAECEAKRRIVASQEIPADLGAWEPDVGGDWTLSGTFGGRHFFANYWPDNTVSASVYTDDGDDGERLADNGIVSGSSKADCQAKAEAWIRLYLMLTNPILRALALPYADHPDYREEWKP